MTRRTAATNEEPQSEAAPAIPPGTQADVTVKYRTRVDPNQDGRAQELADLADLAAETEEPPLDEVSAFCQRWVNFAGQTLSVIRLPDPPERRLAGNSYAHPCFNLERLGDTTFDPDNLISTLQFVNRNSGGIFRIWLSYQGAPVPEARLDRLAIGDPPGSHDTKAPAPLIQNAPALVVPQERQKSESEKFMEDMQRQLMQKALMNALNPPAPVPVSPNGMSTEETATLFLLGKTDFLGSIFGKMTELAQQAGSVAKEPSWKDRAIDAGLELATKNPAIVDRLSGVVERIVARVLPNEPSPLPSYQPQVFQPQPQQYVQYGQPQPPLQAGIGDFDPGLPEAPVPDDDEDDDMDIIERLTTLLNSETPLTLEDPTVRQILGELKQEYPDKLSKAFEMIAAYPLSAIILWIKKTGGPMYVSLLDGPASGPYLRQRLGELQTLIIEGRKHEQQAIEQARLKQHEQKASEQTATPPPAPEG